MANGIKLKTIVVLVILLLIVLGALELFSKYQSAASNPVATLSKVSQNFAAGTNYQNSGNYSSALQSYQQALAQTQDPSQQAVINFRIALMNEFTGNYAQAITQMKQIVADQSTYTNSLPLRAYAAQEIGYMYYKASTPAIAQSIYSDTFTDAPYNTFLQEASSSVSMAYRHLFEYAAGLYPVGYSEARIALWYSNDLITTQKGATTTPQGASDVTMVMQGLQKADVDVQRTDDPTNTSYVLIPPTLQLEGIALGQLANVGAGDSQQAEAYFQKAMQLSSSTPASFTPYDYAVFLAKQYGATRSSDIVKLLAPFKVGNDANVSTLIVSFFKTTEHASNTAQKKNVILLAHLDPGFKTYLISLGWHASDF